MKIIVTALAVCLVDEKTLNIDQFCYDRPSPELSRVYNPYAHSIDQSIAFSNKDEEHSTLNSSVIMYCSVLRKYCVPNHDCCYQMVNYSGSTTYYTTYLKFDILAKPLFCVAYVLLLLFVLSLFMWKRNKPTY